MVRSEINRLEEITTMTGSQRRRTDENRFTSKARKSIALKQLGVSEVQVTRAPEITSLLKNRRRSLKPALRAMYMSGDPVVQCFLAKRSSLGTWARANLCWEAIAVSAGLDLEHLLGATMLALREFEKTIAASHCLDLLEKRIEYAKLPGGWRDRDAIDRLLGLLPVNSSDVMSR